MAGSALGDRAMQGDFIDHIVQSMVHSLVSQLKAEYRKELCKVVEVANVARMCHEGEPPVLQLALGTPEAAAVGTAGLKAACASEVPVGPPSVDPERCPSCQPPEGLVDPPSADLKPSPQPPPEEDLESKVLPAALFGKDCDDLTGVQSVGLRRALFLRQPPAVASASATTSNVEGTVDPPECGPIPPMLAWTQNAVEVTKTAAPLPLNLNVPETEREHCSRGSGRERGGIRKAVNARRNKFNASRSVTSPALRSDIRKRSGASNGGTNSQHAAFHKQSSMTSALPLSTDEEKLLASLREELMHKEELAEKRFGMSEREMLKSRIFEDEVPTSRKIASQIIFHAAFDYVIALFIVMNAVALGLESSLSVHTGEVPAYLVTLEYMFLVIYIVEIGLRFHALGMWTALESNWVKFDFVLVILGVLNNVLRVSSLLDHAKRNVVNDINLLKMVRILRLARTVRLLVKIRTLWLLIQGLMYAVVPMFWTTIIMIVVVYMFSVIGMEVIIDPSAGEEYRLASMKFHSIPDSMVTLMQFMTLDNMEAIYRPLVMGNPVLSFYFVAFFLVGPVSLMGIVTAILVESSIRTAKEDQEAKKVWEAMKKKSMMPKLRCFFEALDADDDGEISLVELLEAPAEIREQLTRIVDLEEVSELFHLLDVDGEGTITIEEFVDGIIRSQEDKPAELLVIVKQCRTILNKLEKK